MINKFKKKRIIFISSIATISLLALFFIISNFKENIVFFYSPSELRDIKVIRKTKDKIIRIGGLVKKGSINQVNALNVRFKVTDLKDEVYVGYHGILPDLFRENQGVVVIGKYDFRRNEIFSEELLIKHDENYMPPEVANSLKKAKK